jgi:prophage antirepressor-like protein
MNELQSFESTEFGSVRTTMINGIPYFVGRDVAAILGYSNTRDALAKHVDTEDKLDGVAICDPIGREQTPVLINESGLYSLILSSKMPNAKKFKRWVTAEVLPAIRKHGVYAAADLLADPDTLIAVLLDLKAEREKGKVLAQTVAVQNQQIVEMQPKVSYYDVVLNCKDLVAISVIAKDYGWSAKHMNAYLHDKGIQFKQGGIWLLYQEHAEKGYTSTKTYSYPGTDGTTHTKVHTNWTQKGRLFIYGVMKEDGHLPLIEQEDTDDD